MNYQKTKLTCFYTYLALSSVFCLPPMLFVTFREMYGVSYTLLGTLVLVNFSTQLLIDLIFTFFNRYFHIHATIRIMPLLTSVGLFVYALIPLLLPQYAYYGFLIGTVIFSIAAGLCEVLMSPLVAAIPSDNPERDMSILHSLYGYGVVTVVLISTLFLHLFGTENWMYLTMFFALLPMVSFVFFCSFPLPTLQLSEGETHKKSSKPWGGLLLCAACIFCGSAAENTMTSWISGYVEQALHIPKTYGDLLGLTFFAILLGLARSLYAKYGKNVFCVLVVGMIATIVCYLIAGLSTIPILSMIACVLSGFTTSMLWPGTLILMEEKFPSPGVAAYALMAAGGDFGGSVAPQMLGAIVDRVSAGTWASNIAQSYHLSTEQVGMKVGMLTATIFPILGVVVLVIMWKYFRKRQLAQPRNDWIS